MSTETIADESEDTPEEKLHKNLRDRLYLPFTIPFIVAITVALLGISFSRIFLAGANKSETVSTVAAESSKSSAPVMWVTIITVVLLFGAAGISAMRYMRTMTFRLILVGVIVLVVVSGAILFSAGEPVKTSLTYGQPTPEEQKAADPNNKVEIEALGNLTFQASDFTAKAGVVHFVYIGVGGTHQLKIKDDRLNWFDLAVTAPATATGDVKLEPGQYTVYCPIQGHQNMHAVLTVK